MQRQDAILCSINDRLGGNPGMDLPPLSSEWLTDLLLVNDQEAKRAEENDEDGGSVADDPNDWETWGL